MHEARSQRWQRRLLSAAMAAAVLTGTGTSSAFADDVLAYGEYLSGECTTCHRIDGKDKGIPPIVGWDAVSFVAVMNSFKTGERDNKAMVSVAKTLDDEQIKALAKYFGSLKPKES